MISDALDSLMAWLCQVIYPLIAYAYKLFYNIGTLRIIKEDNLTSIYNRITLILGLVMLFVVTFQLIQYIMEPDNFNDKEKGLGKVMYRMIISVILIAFVPNIFDFAFELQSDIMDNNIIQNLVLGTKNNYDENWGGQFSASILQEFYRLNPKVSDYECTDSNGMNAENIITLNISTLSNDGYLNALSFCINDKSSENEAENVIKFDGMIAVLSGGLILWMLVMYCLDLGVRVVQLTYLQIIAPIPIIMYILPKKDGAFEKWVKQCITTFLDLFLRTAIICFTILIISTITNSLGDINESISASGQGDEMFTSLIKVCLVLGVMTFAKKAGDMLKELFPKGNAASGELGLSPKNRIPEPAKRIAGAGIGLAAAGTVGLTRRIAGNVKYGKQGKEEKAMLKNRINNAQANLDKAKAKLSGAHDDTTRTAAQSEIDTYQRELKDAKSKLRATNWRYNKGRMAVGMVTGTVSAANRGMVAGLTTKGGLGGVGKATKAVLKDNRVHDEWRENSGGDLAINRVFSGIGQTIGIDPTERYTKRKEKLEKENTALSKYSESFEKAKEAVTKDIEEGKCDGVNVNAKNYHMKKVEAERLIAQAGNLKLTDFKYKDLQEKESTKKQINSMLKTPQQQPTDPKDVAGRLAWRKSERLLKIAEVEWDKEDPNKDPATHKKFSELEGTERESALSKILDKLADEYVEVNYESTVKEYEERSREAEIEANDLKKKATQEVGDMIMNGTYKNDKAAQYLDIAKNAASAGSSDTEVFTGADLVTFANLKELSDKASAQQNVNNRDLYNMQQSPEYKAAQANKQYHDGGGKGQS